MENNIDWANLPIDVLENIFIYLDTYERTVTLSDVCYSWSRVNYETHVNKEFTVRSVLNLDDVIRSLHAAPHLKCLTIINRHDLDLLLNYVGMYNRKLKSLRIKYCQGSICSRKIRVQPLLRLFKRCKFIEELTIKHSIIQSKKLFTRMGSMLPNLRRINFAFDNKKAENFINLPNIIKSGCKNLQSIKIETRFGNKSINDKAIQILCNELGKQVTTLKLDAKELTDKSIDTLLMTCSDLKSLHLLRAKKLTDLSIMKISQFKQLTSFSLTLSNNNSIHWSSNNFFQKCGSQLKKLNVSGCNGINDASLELIQHHCKQLVELNITRCDFTIVALNKLKECTNINVLS